MFSNIMMKKTCTFTFRCFLTLVCLLLTALLAFNVADALVWIERYVFVLLLLLLSIRLLLGQNRNALWASLVIFIFSTLNSLFLLTQVDGNARKLALVLLLAGLGGLLSNCSSCSSRCTPSCKAPSSCKDPSCSDALCSSEEPPVEVYNAGKEELKNQDNTYVNIDDLRKFSQEVKSASKAAQKTSRKITKTTAKKKQAKKNKKHSDDLVL